MNRAAILVLAIALVVVSTPVRAGEIATVIEAPTAPALSLAVSEALFKPGSTNDVVIVDERRPALVAAAAAFAGMTDRRAPVLLAGGGLTANAMRTEIARVTGGPDPVDAPLVWLFGTSLDGLDGYDVRSLTGSDADIAATILELGPGAGTAQRVLVFPEGDWAAGAIAAAFGAAWGVPAIPLANGPLSGRLAEVFDPERGLIAIAIGAVNVPADRFSRVDKVEGATPTALSAAAAKALFEPEHPAGTPIEYPLESVAADGFGNNPGPALLMAVVTAFAQDDHGAKSIPSLVDGRPTAELVAQAPGDTTVLALTSTRSEPEPVGRLPATGGSFDGWSVLALGLVVITVSVVRRSRTGVTS